jgi:hypothetical protein
MTTIALALALFTAAQPLTNEERSTLERALEGVSELTYHRACRVEGFHDGDSIYIVGASWDGEGPFFQRVAAVLDAKTGKRVAGWSDVNYVDPAPTRSLVCNQSFDAVSLSPTRTGAVLHAEDGDQLLIREGEKLESHLTWATRGKDKQTFRVRKSVGNGLFDVELKQGKSVEVYRWDGQAYGVPEALNPYIKQAKASSELPHQGDFTYSALEAIDGAPETTWAEATKGTGVGETLDLTLDGAYVLTKLKLVPGCGFTDDLWLKNERLKKVKITFDDKAEQVADLEDTRKPGEWKTIALTHDKPTASLKLEILDVYPGTAWKDGCISEVAVEARPLPSTGELAKAATFLGATCKTDWAAVQALWKTTAKSSTWNALRDVNVRLKKPDLLLLGMKDETHLDSFSVNGCENAAVLAGMLPKEDLALRLCSMKFEDVRHAFGDPPEKKQNGVLQYPYSGGKLTIWTKDKVTSARLDCTP